MNRIEMQWISDGQCGRLFDVYSKEQQSYRMDSKINTLSPMEFLKNFNRMIEDLDRGHTDQQPPPLANNSRLTPLKKFPIPSYYHQMEGLNVNTKEKEEEELIKANKFNRLDEDFRRKHNNFMRKTLNQMIENNIKHVQTLERGKAFYKTKPSNNKKVLKRAMSMKSIDKGRRLTKFKENGDDLDEVFPEINFKAVDRGRVKSPYMISFHTRPIQTKLKSQSVTKMRDSSKVEEELLKRRTPGLHPAESEVQPGVSRLEMLEENPERQTSAVSVATHGTNKQLPAAPLIKEIVALSCGRRHEEIEILLDTQKYLKSRFSVRSTLNSYDYAPKLKNSADNFTREIIYHYANDYNHMK